VDRAQLRRSLVVLALGGFLALILLSQLPFCPMAGVLGIPCPGCGLTRATLAALHGDLRGAFHLHPLVFVLTPLFVWSIGAAAFGYVRGPRPHSKPKLWLSSRSATLLASALLLATLGVWGARFLGYLGGPVPVVTFRQWAEPRRRFPWSSHPTPGLEPTTSASAPVASPLSP
jgi:hypothetical protein